ncbi:photosynthetic complex assembly protein PuhC [Nereida sp. MMG025]|uniref:photosynthetic complex assembly protein PuhC n=1 Tax=Nereida sp. MMG025 TaxID=2909981 RepID=UPI001EEE91AE|nr:photosynthetic complex assembly protein PuhC [Nereida sp. MMG025]MCF6446008.1 pullulanase [Nereida sp. MMG025]
MAINSNFLSEEEKLVQRDKEMIPRKLVMAMFGMALAVLAIVAFARIAGIDPSAQPPASPVKAEQLITLKGEMSGAVIVGRPDGTIIAELSAEEGGFVSGVARVVERERMKQGIDMTHPVRLMQFENNRLMVVDDQTGWRADLMGFGATNHAAFAKLLAKSGSQ